MIVDMRNDAFSGGYRRVAAGIKYMDCPHREFLKTFQQRFKMVPMKIEAAETMLHDDLMPHVVLEPAYAQKMGVGKHNRLVVSANHKGRRIALLDSEGLVGN
jgi:hypothetical protein